MLSWWYNCTRNTSCIYYPKKNFLKLDENSSWNDKKFIPHYVYFDHIITFFQICKQMCAYIRICHPINLCVYFPQFKTFQVALVMKNLAANAGDTRDAISVPGLGRSSTVGNGNPLQYLAWKIPWAEEPGRLQSTGLQRVRHVWVTEHTHTQVHNIFVEPDTGILPVNNTAMVLSLLDFVVFEGVKSVLNKQWQNPKFLVREILNVGSMRVVTEGK